MVFPAFVIAITLVALAGPSTGLPEPLLFAGTFAVLYTAIALTERRLPYRREWNRPQGDVATDVTHLVVTGIGGNALVQATVAAIAFAAAAWLSRRVGAPLWPNHWPLLAQLALDLLVAEFGHYWFHRLSHENGLVWRVHAAHHSAPRLYWLNATRFHPIDLFALISCQTAPLIALGAGPPALLAYGLFTGAYGQLQHCNIAVRTGPLRFLFSTPELHRWHHSTDPREGNSNYGAVLSTWDLLFGTFFSPADRSFTGPVGLRDLPRFPRDYVGQLLSPFRWRAAQGDA
jgi:sterol desaturase/sphingolipid hydroxylase (fatty acid hydroxylase superfamily)